MSVLSSAPFLGPLSSLSLRDKMLLLVPTSRVADRPAIEGIGRCCCCRRPPPFHSNSLRIQLERPAQLIALPSPSPFKVNTSHDRMRPPVIMCSSSSTPSRLCCGGRGGVCRRVACGICSANSSTRIAARRSPTSPRFRVRNTAKCVASDSRSGRRPALRRRNEGVRRCRCLATTTRRRGRTLCSAIRRARTTLHWSDSSIGTSCETEAATRAATRRRTRQGC